jgi:hypothetical protein
MPSVLPVSLASSCGACLLVLAAPVSPSTLWIGKGSDGSMLTRVKGWIEGSRRKSAERWQADRGHLSEQERHRLDAQEHSADLGGHDVEDLHWGPKAFDETSRRRPGG